MKGFVLALFFALNLQAAFAVHIAIDSPDDETIWPTAKATERLLKWDDKNQALVAMITFRDDLHSNVGSPVQEATLFFHFPNIHIDPTTQGLTVETADGTVIPIAQQLKSFGGNHILLMKNSVILVTKTQGHLHLTLDIDTERNPASVNPAPTGVETYTLDQLLHH